MPTQIEKLQAVCVVLTTAGAAQPMSCTLSQKSYQAIEVQFPTDGKAQNSPAGVTCTLTKLDIFGYGLLHSRKYECFQDSH